MTGLNAGMIAAALVAACVEIGIDPVTVYENGAARRARQLAGAALKSCSGVSAVALAPLLKITNNELSPSLLQRARITTEMMLNVVEAIGGPGRAAEISQGEPPARSEDLGAAEVAALAPDRAGVEVIQKPVPRALRAKAEGTEGAAAAGGAGGGVPADAVKRPRRTREDRKAYLQPRPVAQSMAPARGKAVTRLKPVGDGVARYAGWFVAAEWDVEEVAELFDVHPDALADALEFGVAA